MERVKIADAAIRVKYRKETFVRQWFEFLRPVHKLTAKEMDVASKFVEYYIEINKEVTDIKKLNKRVLSKETKDEICEKLNIKQPHLRTIMQQLRKHRIIVDDCINSVYVPSFEPGKSFRLMILMQDAASTGENNT